MKTKALLLTACTLLATVQATAQKRAERLSLENPESFSMILMGDPQSYVKYDINQPVFELTTAWTADNIENLKIKAVLVTGDLVETNDNAVPVRSMANQTSRQMWESVSRSFERLDNKVPYIISPGNHDYGYRSAENGRTCFPEYFPVERGDDRFKLLQATCALPLLFPVFAIQGKPCMDGGASDAIPFDRAFAKGCDRVIVVLTRERAYIRRAEKLQPMIDLICHKYPKFCDAMRRRADVYNEARQRLFQLEKEGRVLLFAPTSTAGFHRTERDVQKIRALWQDGYDQGMVRLDEVEAFLRG